MYTSHLTEEFGMYKVDPDLDDFPGPKEVAELIRRALEAADRDEQFDETVDVVNEVSSFRMYVALRYQGARPATVEVGQDHSNLLSEDTMTFIKSTPGLVVNTRERWTELPLMHQS